MQVTKNDEIQSKLAKVKIYNKMIVDINSSFEVLTGYSKEELIGKNEEEFIRILRLNISSEGTPSSTNEDYFLCTKLLEEKIVCISIINNKTSNSKEYIFKEKNRNLIVSNLNVFKNILENEELGIALLSMPETIILKANQTYFNFLDSPFNSCQNCIGYKLKDILDSSSTEIINNIWHNHLSLGKVYHQDEFRYDGFKRGTTYWINTLIPIAENKKVKYAVHISSDITKTVMNRKNLEEQSKILTHQMDQLFRIIEILDIPIARISYPELKIIKLNNKMADLINKIHICKNNTLKKDNADTYIKEIINSFDSIENLNRLKRMEETKSAVYHNVEYTFGNTTYYFKIVYQPYINNIGEITELILIAYDITNEISQNKALIDAMNMQREFFSFISHEFKTPLSITNAAVQVLQLLYKNEIPNGAMLYIEKIKKSALQQIRLVNNLLDISRADSGYLKLNKRNMDIVQATQAIVESVGIYADTKGINLHFKSIWKRKIIAIDDEKYERILLNLLSNAIKFTPEGKSIKVSLSRKKKMICIKVVDEGVGIPQDKISLIFERFGQVNSNLTRSSEGTGIGLYLVKTLVNALGGIITAESTPSKGSTFTFFLPEAIVDNNDGSEDIKMADSRLIQAANIEFSNIYFE